ncbi:MAG: GNAT family protein [Bacteroidota bacterium]
MVLSPTPDLQLRDLSESDATRLFGLLDANRSYLREWLPWLDTQRAVQDSIQFIRTAREFSQRHESQALGIWYRGELCGIISFHRIDWPNNATMVGYWLSAEFQGKGIMTEACKAFVDFGFAQLGLHRIEIRCAPGNLKSRAIPERLGFTMEATLRDCEWLYDHYVDLIVYSMLAPDWKKAHHT